MLDIPFLFDDPYYEGLATPRLDVPGVAAVGLAGRLFAIEPKLYQRNIVPPYREPRDQGSEPAEQSLTTKGSWARTCRRWDHGAGQVQWDTVDGSNRFRFRESQGADIFSEQGVVGLLNDTRNIRSTTATNVMTMAVGGYLYAVDGTALHFTADPSGASPSWTDSVAQAYATAVTITDVCSDGGRMFVAAAGNGIAQVAVGGTTGTQFSATQVGRVWYANGRLFGANAHVLYEFSAAGAPTIVKTHGNTSFVWRSVVGANNGIYASGYLNDQNELFYIGVDDTGALTVPRFAAPLPDGEFVLDMKFYVGVLLVRTNRGVRLGVIQSDQGISFGLFVPVPADYEQVQGTLLEPQGEDVWFDWPGIGLGRARLTDFTRTLVPAYATDLAAASIGTISGIASFSTEQDENDMPIYKRYFAVRGAGVFAEYDSLVSEGFVTSGWVDFGVPLAKVLHSVDWKSKPLSGTMTFAIRTDLDEATYTNVAVASAEGSTTPTGGPIPVVFTQTENMEVRVTLERDGDDATLGPELRRWTLRAFPVTVPTVEWYLPVILRSGVEYTFDKQVSIDPGDELEFLETLVLLGTPVVFQVGDESSRVRVDEVQAPAMDTRRWTDDYGFLQGIYMVHLVEVN